MIISVRRLAILACAGTFACTGHMGGNEGAPTSGGSTTATAPAPTPTIAATGGSGAVAPSSPVAVSAASGATQTPPAQVTTPISPASADSTSVAPAAMPTADECGLKTQYRGDEFCIKPPPADKGVQIHVGPKNYDNPEPQYLVEPGQEVTEPYNAVSPNDKEVYFFYRQQRMRPGSHHLLIFYGNDLIVSAQNPISDTPAGGKIAPEDEDAGISLPAHAPLTGSIHYINTTDKPILKEAWINLWFKDASAVKERASPIFARAPINILPGQHVVVSGDCPIMGSGRIIRLFGHKHANNVRWSTFRVRGGQRELLFEDYDHWEEPLILEYSSITQNNTPDAAKKTPGGFSGIVDVQQGDTLRFECEIINNTNNVFVGQNEAKDDEMCIQNGTIVGATIPYTCRTATTPVN